jgi:PAS domain S-box-containing protein
MVARESSEWPIFRFAAICFAVGAAALIVSSVADLAGERGTLALSDGGLVAFSGVAAVACFRAARSREPDQRLPWLLLATAASCYTIGNTIWFYYQVLAPDSQTFPGPADIFYVALVPFVVLGMLTLPSLRLSAAARARAVADGLIIAAALLFVSWILVVGPLFDQLGEVGPLYLFVYLCYPLADILIISIASVLAVRAAGAERLPLLLVAAAFVAIGCADTGISYLALKGKDAAGSGFDVGWTAGYMLLALAALAPVTRAPRKDTAADPRALTRELLPYVPLTVVLITTATSPDLLTDPGLVTIMLSLVMLLVLRHMLTLADNIGLTRDLEHRVQQRTLELERLTSQHQSILDSAGEGIIGLDRTGRVTFANPVAGEIVGRSAEELVGTALQEVLRVHDGEGIEIPAADHPATAAMAEGRVQSMTDAVHRRHDGEDVPIELTVTPRRDAGEVTGAVVLFRDVTERRALDKMKNEFVSVVSHELRTPLTSVRGALGLLQGGLLADSPPKAQRMIAIAVESTDRLIRLINDILDIERITAGNIATRRRECSAADLVDRAVREMRGLALQAGVTVTKGLSTGRLDADPDQIVQTLTNLLSNAIKFSSLGDTVRIAAVEDADTVLFTVSDEGRGIPGDELEAVFGRFAQIDSADTRENDGTGLGLAICRGIVELHGGRIWAESVLGQGSAFKFTLPAVPGRADSAAEPDDRTRPTVLVCEADPQARAVICDVLSAHGYRVTVADSSEQAMSLATAQVPSAIVMDLGLLGAQGWAAFGDLRADERTRRVPMVILGGSEKEDTPGDTAWLSRPLDVTALLSKLDRAVRGLDGRPRILLVEDDPGLGEVMRGLFDQHGVYARQALTGHEALQLSRDLAPDLILLDLLLPDVDGFALAEWLHAGPGLSSVPLIVYSALELDEDDRLRLGLGPDECFTKATTSPEEVERRVLDLLDHVITGAARSPRTISSGTGGTA